MTLNDVAEILLQNDNFEILTHAHPDGDCLGSGYGLCLALQQAGKNARVITVETPKVFDYLKNGVENQDFEAEYIVSVDVADEKLLGENQEAYQGRINLCIDHHMVNVVEADHKYIESDSAAAAQIIYKLLGCLGTEITKDIANCLYTGIATDTGCFKYTNTTGNTLRAAADLIDAGCDSGYINRVMFDTKTKKHIQLEKDLYDNIIYCCNDQCAIIHTTLEMEKTMEKEDMEGISAIPRGIEGVEMGITIREKDNGLCKISVRTHGKYDACAFCQQFGGGGHKAAAGCAIKGSVDEVISILMDAAEKVI